MGEVVSYTKAGIEALIADAIAAAGPSGDSMGVVVHGADANVARPEGYAVVYWIGSVEPVNAEINDFRVDPDASPATIEFATQADIDASIAALVDTAPGTLDTLNELAAALGDDANFAATINSAIAALDTRVDTLEADGSSSVREIVVGGVAVGDAEFVAASTTQGQGATATAAKPAGTTEGHLLVAYIIANQDPAPSAPAGWVQATGSPFDGSSDRSIFVFVKQAGASEGTQYAFGLQTASIYYALIIATYSNASPTGVTVSAANGATAPDVLVPSGGVASVFAGNAGGQVNGTPGGYTSRAETGGAVMRAGLFTEAFPVGGQTGTATSTNANEVAHVVIAKPEQTAHTLALTDAGKVVEMTASTASTVTIPADASVDFPVGSFVHVRRSGAGEVTIEAGVGVTLQPGEVTLDNQYDEVVLHKRAANIWHVLDVTAEQVTQAELDAVVASLAIIGTNNQTGTTYSLVLADAGKVVELNNAAAITVTIPADSAVDFPIGTVIELSQEGAGQVEVTPAVGVTLSSVDDKRKLFGPNAAASLRKRAANNWRLVGDLVT